MAKTTDAITVYQHDIEILEEEANRRAKEYYGQEYNVFDPKNRKELIQLRKDILHEIISRSKYGRKRSEK
jgi:hypothetical protein